MTATVYWDGTAEGAKEVQRFLHRLGYVTQLVGQGWVCSLYYWVPSTERNTQGCELPVRVAYELKDLRGNEKMSKYAMRIELPDNVRKFFAELHKHARVVSIENDGSMATVEFDYAGDEWGLAFRAMEVAREPGGEELGFERPVLVYEADTESRVIPTDKWAK